MLCMLHKRLLEKKLILIDYPFSDTLNILLFDKIANIQILKYKIYASLCGPIK